MLTNHPTTSASAISALLRRHGFNPMGSANRRSREGVRVTRSAGGTVTVSADLDSPAAAARMAADLESTLTGAGYAVTRFGDAMMRVAKAS